MRLQYISPSVLPSRTANSVHVALQCDALARAGAELTLYFMRSIPDPGRMADALAAAYGIDATDWRLVSYLGRSDRAATLQIALMALADIPRRPKAYVLSRNLYAAFSLGVMLRRPLIYEAHDIEAGMRGRMQRAIISCPWVSTVAISQSLVRHLTERHHVPPARVEVLHDAAPSGMVPLPREVRRVALAEVTSAAAEPWTAVCGYFGHLYPGRGVGIIERMAAVRPEVLFLVVGGNEPEVEVRRGANSLANLRFLGHFPNHMARAAMRAVDILLMPYQRKVSIGVAQRDTAEWMSPMKMFEYLGAGVPIISSDLPVLREILSDGHNALLVPPESVEDWVTAVDRLISEPDLADRLGRTGHDEYLARHTWDQRARALLEVARAQHA